MSTVAVSPMIINSVIKNLKSGKKKKLITEENETKNKFNSFQSKSRCINNNIGNENPDVFASVLFKPGLANRNQIKKKIPHEKHFKIRHKSSKRSSDLSVDHNDVKKTKLSIEKKSTNTNTEFEEDRKNIEVKAIDKEIQRIKNNYGKIRKLKKVDLEKIIVELFVCKFLHEHKLGEYRELVHKLERNLDLSRNKVSQFRREVEDLRKVTKHLQKQHETRKNQIATPVQIKRSVGVQVHPHIIKSEVNEAQIIKINTNHLVTNKLSSIGKNQDNFSKFQSTVRLAKPCELLCPLTNGESRKIKSDADSNLQNISLAQTDRFELVDLTHKHFKEKKILKETKLNSENQGTILSSNDSCNTSELVVSPEKSPKDVSTSISNQCINRTSPKEFEAPTDVLTSKANEKSINIGATEKKLIHPVPLPLASSHTLDRNEAIMSCAPILNLIHKDNSIILSWNMSKPAVDETIVRYHLFGYQEIETPTCSTFWKKVGSVKALELPMACTLSQFQPCQRYHFTVRAEYVNDKLGPYSEPKSIQLDK